MTEKTIKPAALVPGDAIAVISPSAGLAARYPRRTIRGVKALESLGFTVVQMPHANGDTGWLSGSIEDRVSDIHAAFADANIKAVICTIGGNHSAQLLASLDYELIAANPKIVCGYSDVTSLLHAVYRETGLVTFYGPAVLAQFGEWPEPFPETVAHFRTVVCGTGPVGEIPSFDTVVGEFIDWAEDEVRPRRRVPATGRRAIRDTAGEGPLVVGCLPTIRHLLGTPWQVDYRGTVLALDIPDMGYRIEDLDADLWYLRNAGVLADLAGLLVGRPRLLAAEDIDQLCDVVSGIVAPYDYPVVAQVECGHSDPVATLPIGVHARLSGTTITVTEPAVATDVRW